MSYLHTTRDYCTVMSFIVGHEYVTVATRQGHAPMDVINAVIEYVGDERPHKPFVILSTERLYPDDFEDFLALELANVVLD